MVEYLFGLATGIALTLAIGAWIGLRISKRQRRNMRLFADMQTALFDVQDAVAMGLGADSCNSLRSIRDTAAARYFAAVGE